MAKNTVVEAQVNKVGFFFVEGLLAQKSSSGTSYAECLIKTLVLVELFKGQCHKSFFHKFF